MEGTGAISGRNKYPVGVLHSILSGRPPWISRSSSARATAAGPTGADPVAEDQLAQVLEAARLSPTADNRQPFRLVVIHTAGREQELRRVYDKDWFVQAPLVIAACGVPAENWVRKQDGKNYNDVDVAIVMDHLILAAADLGLGTCWIAAFDPAAARELLELPEGVEPVAFTPLGHPADTLEAEDPQEIGRAGAVREVLTAPIDLLLSETVVICCFRLTGGRA